MSKTTEILSSAYERLEQTVCDIQEGSITAHNMTYQLELVLGELEDASESLKEGNL